MNSIQEFDLQLVASQGLILPLGSVPLSVQVKDGKLKLWALVPPLPMVYESDPVKKEKRTIWVTLIQTGAPTTVQATDHFLGTVQFGETGALTLHAFIRRG